MKCLLTKGNLTERSKISELTEMNKSNTMFSECFHMYERCKYIYGIRTNI